MTAILVPERCLVVLIGASGSGKSTFASRHFAPTEVLSSDAFRGLVGDDENDMAATEDAFAALYLVADGRLRRGRFTVIDATNVTPASREPLVGIARRHRAVPVAIVLDVPSSVCIDRNRKRRDRRLDAGVIRRHGSSLRRSIDGLEAEGFERVVVLRGADAVDSARIVRAEREKGPSMEQRRLGKTGYVVGAVGLGAWAIGAEWGPVDDEESLRALHAAVDAGVTFFDTADVYGDGRSERLIGRLLRERGERLVVATKMGRRLPQERRSYSASNFRVWIDRSREHLGVETVDLVQLHCPPDEVIDADDVFDALDGLVADGSVAHYGVSVETVDQAFRAIRRQGVATIQIIFNMFRQKPAREFLPAAAGADVGVIARVPLASGLLTGRMSADTTFPENDHRNYNRQGAAFDVGETFSGVPLEAGLEAVEELRPLADGGTLAQVALRWILSFDEVSTVIPGAKSPRQARENAAVGAMPPLDESGRALVADVYERRIAPHVEHRW
jgi:aryl-alcohol dehydrogenase-like predicted oxidoreductase/predicted kinase